MLLFTKLLLPVVNCFEGNDVKHVNRRNKIKTQKTKHINMIILKRYVLGTDAKTL